MFLPRYNVSIKIDHNTILKAVILTAVPYMSSVPRN